MEVMLRIGEDNANGKFTHRIKQDLEVVESNRSVGSFN